MSVSPGEYVGESEWKPLRPLLLKDVQVFELEQGLVLVCSSAGDRVIDVGRGLVREHRSGRPAGVEPRSFDGEVVVGPAQQDRLYCDHRSWERYERMGEIGVFVEVSELEYQIAAIENDAYDRDDASDFFAFTSGHQVPIAQSLQVIVQALDSSEPRIRMLAASALGYLVRHRAHGCYTRDEEQALEKTQNRLEAVARAGQDRELAEEYARCLKWPEPLVP